MGLRVLTWNLMHGRAVPPAARYLEDEFAAALGRWEWDVALLQEVPPWWPEALAPRLQADQRLVLTSRNVLAPVRRALAIRWPDGMKSNGGGANAILVRRGRILEHRTLRLCLLPERRWVHAVRVGLDDDAQTGLWAGNLHLSAHKPNAATREATSAAHAVLEWAAGRPAVLGGDFNVRFPSVPGFERAGGHGVDHLLVSGLRAAHAAEVLVRGLLSDHAPLAVNLVPDG
ncbi:MAG: endonuclease/exonuclease/phosphatase family protein [Actinomycetota bacterium]|nr:endonuclease/exonuclease/phosphatase family protein [Actinomycetota bacterium]